jgi:hypothetical protein
MTSQRRLDDISVDAQANLILQLIVWIGCLEHILIEKIPPKGGTMIEFPEKEKGHGRLRMGGTVGGFSDHRRHRLPTTAALARDNRGMADSFAQDAICPIGPRVIGTNGGGVRQD